MIYQPILAELRRLHSDAPWELGGVVVEGTWRPGREDLVLPSIRAIEAGNVMVVESPAVLAPDDASAVRLALDMAGEAGWPLATPIRSQWIEVASVSLDELIDAQEV